MAKVLDRTDDMLILRGMNVFPSQVEKLLLEFDEVAPQYQITVDREERGLDTVEVQAEPKESFFNSSDPTRLKQMERKIRKRLVGALTIPCKVALMKPHSLKRSEGKAIRVVDRRKLAA
jgi:phenylacetate-CoA ligase